MACIVWEWQLNLKLAYFIFMCVFFLQTWGTNLIAQNNVTRMFEKYFSVFSAQVKLKLWTLSHCIQFLKCLSKSFVHVYFWIIYYLVLRFVQKKKQPRFPTWLTWWACIVHTVIHETVQIGLTWFADTSMMHSQISLLTWSPT